MHIVVIGAGAAGLIAAAEAASRSQQVTLLEKNSKTGVKILMSGGTRCNLTHHTNAKGIVDAFGHAAKFLQHSVGSFPPPEVVQMFTRLGVLTKVENTGKVFPQSDRALDVRDALQRQAIESGVSIVRNQAVQNLTLCDGQWQIDTQSDRFLADRVIVSAGGRSWPGCGTTGDAYDWLTRLGHTITATRPALVPLTGGNQWMHELSGITLEDCQVTAENHSAGLSKTDRKMTRRSSWLFTHFGFSGPAAMDVSRVVTLSEDPSQTRLQLDMLPDRSADSIECDLLDSSAGGGRRHVSSLLAQWLPNRLAQQLAMVTCGDKTIAELPKVQRKAIVANLKRLCLPISGTRGFAKAEVTAGGVSLAEVNPKTMESRIVKDLFIAGEVLDVDGWIGGYNFQAAFSTGRAAGVAAASLGSPQSSNR